MLKDLNILMNYALTDSGNAERLENALAERFAYVEELKKWLRFTGKRWQETTPEKVMDAACEVFRMIRNGIYDLPQTTDKAERQQREAVLSWLEKSENANKLKNAVTLLKGKLLVPYSEFDSEPNLLNLQNGTLDLTTFNLYPHRAQDRLTKICGAEYHEHSNGKFFDVVREILPDDEVRAYVKRFLGYCLTASTQEEKILIACGPGGHGKGTLFETVAAVLGDYKDTIPVDVLLSSGQYGNGQAPSPELAKLPGKRLVLSSESGKGRKLDEAKLKLLTGGDTLTARRLQAEPFQFRPAFKLVIETNFLPVLADSTDKGITRRLVTIPFNSEKITTVNTKLKSELLQPENLSQCLEWLLQGLGEWRRQGLGEIPAAAAEMATKYYASCDLVALWLEENTEESGGFLQVTKAYNDFSEWLGAGKKWQRITFTEAMEQHGYTKQRFNGGIGFKNIALKNYNPYSY